MYVVVCTDFRGDSYNLLSRHGRIDCRSQLPLPKRERGMGFDFDLQFAITDSKRQSFAIASPLEALFGGEIFAPKVGRASLLLEHLNELTRGKMLADIEEAQRATN